jgi:hypothetical protein
MTTLGFFLLFWDIVVVSLVGIVFFLTRGVGGSYFGTFAAAVHHFRDTLLFTALLNLLYLCLLLTVSATT